MKLFEYLTGPVVIKKFMDFNNRKLRKNTHQRATREIVFYRRIENSERTNQICGFSINIRERKRRNLEVPQSNGRILS